MLIILFPVVRAAMRALRPAVKRGTSGVSRAACPLKMPIISALF